jgi:Haemolysin-III related
VLRQPLKPERGLQGGAALYAFRFPECLKPGGFDYLFNSHQLFHLAVVIAAFVHYRACLVRHRASRLHTVLDMHGRCL